MLGVRFLVVGVWFSVLGVRECVGWNVLVFSSVFCTGGWWCSVLGVSCCVLGVDRSLVMLSDGC